MYTFAGWNDGTTTYAPAELPAVTGPVTYTVVFTSAARPYTVTFRERGGDILQTSTVLYGETPSYTGQIHSVTGAVFAGWSDGTTTYAPGTELPPVTGDAAYTATYLDQRISSWADLQTAFNLGVGTESVTISPMSFVRLALGYNDPTIVSNAFKDLLCAFYNYAAACGAFNQN